MSKQGKSVLEYIDDVYNLAYWMTGNEASTGMLVSQIYLNVDSEATATELFSQFRKLYLNAFGQVIMLNTDDLMLVEDSQVARAIINLPADFKLVVLLADVVELTHAEIASIIGKPVDTVRSWLHWGRKLLGHELAEKVAVN
ncbi:MAG: RNA polymerase subunit sigma-24 [Chlorobiales bacterium]|jgi:hypothetical protein|nr:RNA polymerase subunit sigma-24 [Chlorobiales bacterium]